MKKRLLSMALAFCMCLSLLPTAAFAEETDTPVSTADLVYDAGVKGKFPDETNTLSISGGLKLGEACPLKTAEELGVLPAEKGIVFAGWTLNPDAKDVSYWAQMTLPEIVTQVTAETSDPVTVYAVWDADMNEDGVPDRVQSCVLHFDMNQEVFSEGHPTNDAVILPGYKLTAPDPYSLNPSKAVGVGWSLSPCDKLLTVNDKAPDDMLHLNGYVATEDVTFYAVWGLDEDHNQIPDLDQKVRISYVAEDAQNVPERTSVSWLAEEDGASYSHVTVPISSQIPTKEGYVFKGWEDEYRDIHLDAGVTSLEVKAEMYMMIVLHAVWERMPGYQIHYSVLFDVDGVEPDKVPAPLEADVDADSYTFTLPASAPERQGAEFLYWSYEDEQYNEVHLLPGDEITLREDSPSRTLYANWKVYNTFTFDTDFGKPDTVPARMYITEVDGEKAYITLPTTPVPEWPMYRFTGYQINIAGSADAEGGSLPGLYQPGDRVELRAGEDYVAYPQWEAVPKMTITLTYDACGGQLPFEETDQEEIVFGDSAVFFVPGGTPTRSGYTFKEWNAEKDGSGKTYYMGSTVITDEDVTLYAVWTKNPEQPDPDPETPDPETPDTPDPVQPVVPTNPGVADKAPQTGDSSNLMLWTLVSMASLGGAAVLNRKKKHSTK